jgi:hypothetical protein
MGVYERPSKIHLTCDKGGCKHRRLNIRVDGPSSLDDAMKKHGWSYGGEAYGYRCPQHDPAKTFVASLKWLALFP